jgi:hypothetical protein
MVVPSMEVLETAIAAVVAGDMSGLSTVLGASHPELQNAASNLPQLSISRSALTRVLNDWGSGTYDADNVQQWASFVRRGYVAGRGNGAIHPIDIEYDASDEELIVEIIGRFDEIGDLVDGRIDENEQVEMPRALTE